MSGSVAPSNDSWVAAIHVSAHAWEPLGAGVVIDERRVLTCAHVVKGERPELWVAFPKADNAFVPRRRVRDVRTASQALADLAVLELHEPVPAGVVPARLRCPQPAGVVGKRWWAFGFAGYDPVGNSADGVVGAALGYGWMRLDTESRYPVQAGFSGGGLWSPDYDAVIGIVGAANDRDGRALALRHADQCLPDEKLRELVQWTVAAAGEMALSAWGWSLETDEEARRHWKPRARGVSVDAERGFRFRGRRVALTEIVAWLGRERADRRVLVVTGSPGVGKSAVLGRVVTTADAGVATALPAGDDAVRATVGSVGCAVHAKGKTVVDVAMEIARAASAPLAERVDDLVTGLHDVLADRHGRRFNVVIDALDEAYSPAEARAIVTRVALPIAETCADVGAQVVVGTRRRDDAGDLLRLFGAARVEIDLDTPEYFAVEDLTAYALATLQLRGDERPGNPYDDDTVARPVAARIAALAGQNFLVAGLTARDHGLHDTVAADPLAVTFTGTVDAALDRYLERVPGVGGVAVRDALTALAFAEAPGLTPDLWQLAIHALYGHAVPAERLSRFARGPAANFLVESAGTTYRLFHQALSDTLVRARADLVPQEDDERALTRAFHAYGASLRWDRVPAYVLRSLPGHAVRAGLVDELLADDEYLLHADLRRLTPAAHAATPAGRQRVRLLRLTHRAIDAEPADRAALFSVTETLESLGSTYHDRPFPLPYRARWATATPRSELAVLEGHTGQVNALCPITVDGQSLLASGGNDGTVRLWDPTTGQQRRILEAHAAGGVWALCAITVEGQTLLAAASDDRTVRLWDPATGRLRRDLEGHRSWVKTLCAVIVDGRALLATAPADEDGAVWLWDIVAGRTELTLPGDTGGVEAMCTLTTGGQTLLAYASYDGTVSLWDPATDQLRDLLEVHARTVNAVCAVTVDGQTLLASATNDGIVQLWDLATDQPRHTLAGHTSGVEAVCEVTVDGHPLLATASDDGTVRLWDPATGDPRRTLQGHNGAVWAVCAVTVDGQTLLASAGDDGTVRLWDPADPATSRPRRTREAHNGAVWAVCAVTLAGQTLLASAGQDGTVRLWDPATGHPRRTMEGHNGGVRAVCAVIAAGQTLLASASDDGTVRLWDLATGHLRHTLAGHTRGVEAVCTFTVDGQTLLASASDDDTVRLWELATGHLRHTLKGHTDWVREVCAVTVEGQTLLASASDDGTVRLWDPATGHPQRILEGHTGWLWAVCAVTVDGQTLLASASHDTMVRLWDPTTGQLRHTLKGHTGGVRAVCAVDVDGQALLASASHDRTVRLWDPTTGACRLVLPVHYQALALCWLPTSNLLAVGLSAGILTISLPGRPGPYESR